MQINRSDIGNCNLGGPAVMNLVVLLLTKIQKFPFNLRESIKGMLILTMALGLPLSIMASRHYARRIVTAKTFY